MKIFREMIACAIIVFTLLGYLVLVASPLGFILTKQPFCALGSLLLAVVFFPMLARIFKWVFVFLDNN